MKFVMIFNSQAVGYMTVSTGEFSLERDSKGKLYENHNTSESAAEVA